MRSLLLLPHLVATDVGFHVVWGYSKRILTLCVGVRTAGVDDMDWTRILRILRGSDTGQVHCLRRLVQWPQSGHRGPSTLQISSILFLEDDS